MTNIVILCLSDLHISEKDTLKQKKVREAFIQHLAETKENQPNLTPDFICLAGDIVSKGSKSEFDEAKVFLENILSVFQPDSPGILMAPGNHDVNFPGNFTQEERENYINQITSLLQFSPTGGDAINTPLVNEIYKNYNTFRRQWASTPYIPYFKTDELKYTTGCALFEKEKIAFLELNNTWLSIPKDENKERKYNLRFGQDIITHFTEIAEPLKKDNYTFISLFHHPLSVLSLDELKPHGRDQFCIYDNIIKMSDICISGHLHGVKIKSPDLLANQTQYVYNGAFCDMHRGHQDCSASFIILNIVEKQLQFKPLVYSNEKRKWEETPESKEFFAETHFPLCSSRSNHPSDDRTLKNREVSWKNHSEKESLFKQIIAANFGKEWELKKDNGSKRFYIQHTKEPDKISTLFIDMDEYKEESIKPWIPGQEKTLIAFYANSASIKKNYGIYLNLKENYLSNILRGQVIFFFTSVNIIS